MVNTFFIIPMTVTTEQGGRQNMFAKEPRMYVDPTFNQKYGAETYAERAEKANGRAAMVGIVFGLFSYALTGNFFFGLLWDSYLLNTSHYYHER